MNAFTPVLYYTKAIKQISFRTWRWAAASLQAILIVIIPFIRLGNESVLRFDVPSLRLYFFGSSLWISESYLFLLVVLLFFVGIMLVTVLYGRIWCGWTCPQTVLSDFARLIERLSGIFAGRGRTALTLVLFQGLLILFSTFVATTLVWYFVSPYEMIPRIVSLSLGPWTLGSWIFFAVLIYLDLAFVRQRFCTSVCPYARMQSAFFDHKTLTIAFDPFRTDECNACEACVRACPAGIDIRAGLQVECINCAECIDTCSDKMKRFNKRSLINYFFGIANESDQHKSRPRVLWLSLVFAFLAGLFVYQVAVRIPVDFWVENETMQRNVSEGPMYLQGNRYRVTVENRSLAPAAYRLTVAGLDLVEVRIRDNPLELPADSAKTVIVYIVRGKEYSDVMPAPVWFTIENIDQPEIRITREARFFMPAARGEKR